MALARFPTVPKAAYGSPQPRAAVKRTYPNERGWGPGWPSCGAADDQLSVLVTRPRDGQRFTRPFHKQVAALATYLLQSTMDLGGQLGTYEIRRNDEPDGGLSTYVCRAIKHSSPPVPSWHSWGLAVDVNLRGNPMLVENPTAFRSTHPAWMVELWESAGWGWGGRYTRYADAMHFEYLYRPTDVAADLANAQAAHAKIRARLLPTVEVPVTSEQVKLLQRLLNAQGAGIDEDGVFGAQTEAALRAGLLAGAKAARLAAAGATFAKTVEAAAAAYRTAAGGN